MGEENAKMKKAKKALDTIVLSDSLNKLSHIIIQYYEVLMPFEEEG